MKYPEYQAILEQAITTPEQTLTELEELQYQVNHATIGYYVASSWRIPRDVCQIILQHHDRHFLDVLDGTPAQDLFAVLKLSEHIITLRNSDCAAADWPYVKDGVLSVLSLSEDALEELITEVTPTQQS